jgi:hypothetical protein
VVGGGPAGFFGALRFGSLCPQASILILEKDDHVLQKLLISGGGRCNITHDCDDPRELIKFYPRGGKALLNAFYQFGPQHLLTWFEEHGLNFYCDPEGCYFPITDKAQSVVDVLVKAAEHFGIRVWTQAGMRSITHDVGKEEYSIQLSVGEEVVAPLVLIATGGNRDAMQVAARFGLATISPIPSLFAFKMEETFLEDLAGITVEQVNLALPGTPFSQSGVLLITHRGLSGPAVINLSAWAARLLHDKKYRQDLVIDWLPGEGRADLSLNDLKTYKLAHGSKTVSQRSPFDQLSERLWKGLVRQAGMAADLRWGDLSLTQLVILNRELRGGVYHINGRDIHRQEFVTCGGVDLKEVDLSGFESRSFPGLCFAGEVLDIDGLTGGYNLQNCWTTGWIAGERLAQKYPGTVTKHNPKTGYD